MRWNAILSPKFVIISLSFILIGCGDVRDITQREALLDPMVKTNAPESLVYEKLPLKWTVYEKGSSKGDAFGASLLEKTSADLDQAKKYWRYSDRALWHTTESVVTIVFIKTNAVLGYYLGVQ